MFINVIKYLKYVILMSMNVILHFLKTIKFKAKYLLSMLYNIKAKVSPLTLNFNHQWKEINSKEYYSWFFSYLWNILHRDQLSPKENRWAMPKGSMLIITPRKKTTGSNVERKVMIEIVKWLFIPMKRSI